MTLREAAQIYRARKKAKVARILDYFHGLHPAILAKLTDRQIDDLFLHLRDDDGRIRIPRKRDIIEEPETLEKALRDLERVRLFLGPRLGNYEEAKKALLKKFNAGQADGK